LRGWAGDEFIALLPDLGESDQATRFVYRMLSAVREPLTIEHRVLSLTASAGVAFFPNDSGGGNAESLLQAASSAMHQAKREHRGGFRFAGSPEAMRQTLPARDDRIGPAAALAREETALAYQLQYDVATGKPCGGRSAVALAFRR
jgi:predicted signal transduction protein with EAL and GGDEF domain